MMSVQEESLRLHGCGFNCAQSVLAALGSYTGLDEKTFPIREILAVISAWAPAIAATPRWSPWCPSSGL